jgi:hypothetical protein
MPLVRYSHCLLALKSDVSLAFYKDIFNNVWILGAALTCELFFVPSLYRSLPHFLSLPLLYLFFVICIFPFSYSFSIWLCNDPFPNTLMSGENFPSCYMYQCQRLTSNLLLWISWKNVMTYYVTYCTVYIYCHLGYNDFDFFWKWSAMIKIMKICRILRQIYEIQSSLLSRLARAWHLSLYSKIAHIDLNFRMVLKFVTNFEFIERKHSHRKKAADIKVIVKCM